MDTSQKTKIQIKQSPVLQEFTHTGQEDVLIENENPVELNARIENRHRVMGAQDASSNSI